MPPIEQARPTIANQLADEFELPVATLSEVEQQELDHPTVIAIQSLGDIDDICVILGAKLVALLGTDEPSAMADFCAGIEKKSVFEPYQHTSIDPSSPTVVLIPPKWQTKGKYSWDRPEYRLRVIVPLLNDPDHQFASRDVTILIGHKQRLIRSVNDQVHKYHGMENIARGLRAIDHRATNSRERHDEWFQRQVEQPDLGYFGRPHWIDR